MALKKFNGGNTSCLTGVGNPNQYEGIQDGYCLKYFDEETSEKWNFYKNNPVGKKWVKEDFVEIADSGGIDLPLVNGSYKNNFVVKNLEPTSVISLIDRLILLIPVVRTAWTGDNRITGEIVCSKTGSNLFTTFSISAQSNYYKTDALFLSNGDNNDNKFITCIYQGVEWLALKFKYNPNPYNNYWFKGFFIPKDSNEDALKVLDFYDYKNSKVLNKEIYDSIKDFVDITSVTQFSAPVVVSKLKATDLPNANIDVSFNDIIVQKTDKSFGSMSKDSFISRFITKQVVKTILGIGDNTIITNIILPDFLTKNLLQKKLLDNIQESIAITNSMKGLIVDGGILKTIPLNPDGGIATKYSHWKDLTLNTKITSEVARYRTIGNTVQIDIIGLNPDSRGSGYISNIASIPEELVNGGFTKGRMFTGWQNITYKYFPIFIDEKGKITIPGGNYNGYPLNYSIEYDLHRNSDGSSYIDAGEDITIRLPTTTCKLRGQGSTPNGSNIEATWSPESVPAGAGISYSVNTLEPTVNGLTVVGDYVFRLTSKSNPDLYDEVTVHVLNGSAPKSVIKDIDETRLYSDGTNYPLSSEGSKGGNSAIASYLWEDVTGDGNSYIQNTTSANAILSVGGDIKTTRTIKLTITNADGESSSVTKSFGFAIKLKLTFIPEIVQNTSGDGFAQVKTNVPYDVPVVITESAGYFQTDNCTPYFYWDRYTLYDRPTYSDFPYHDKIKKNTTTVFKYSIEKDVLSLSASHSYTITATDPVTGVVVVQDIHLKIN